VTDGQTDGRTDGRTDRILITIPRLHYMQRRRQLVLKTLIDWLIDWLLHFAHCVALWGRERRSYVPSAHYVIAYSQHRGLIQSSASFSTANVARTQCWAAVWTQQTLFIRSAEQSQRLVSLTSLSREYSSWWLRGGNSSYCTGVVISTRRLSLFNQLFKTFLKAKAKLWTGRAIVIEA